MPGDLIDNAGLIEARLPLIRGHGPGGPFFENSRRFGNIVPKIHQTQLNRQNPISLIALLYRRRLNDPIFAPADPYKKQYPKN